MTGTLCTVKLPWRRSPRPDLEQEPDWLRRRRVEAVERREDLLGAPTTRLRRARELEHPSDGAILVTTSIGPTGEIAALWSDASGSEALMSMTTSPGGARFPDSVPTTPASAVVTIQTRGIDQVVTLPELNLVYPKIQPLPDGEVLLVGARCRFRPIGAEENALRLDEQGDVVAAAVFGDGIQDVLVNGRGAAWVAYFDEGVFGNYGWGGPDGPEPIGSSGLVRFSRELEMEWEYAPETQIRRDRRLLRTQR